MFAPRTVKTLIALFVAMTGGTMLLMALDTDPIQAPGTHLVAVAVADEAELAVVTQTDMPLRRWHGVVVHTLAEGQAALDRCHFIIEPTASGGVTIRSNGWWMKQQASSHERSPGGEWNTSIGVGLMGEYSRQAPSNAQMQALIKLITDLQIRFRIPSSRVYLYGDISSRIASPGPAFPVAYFQDALVDPR